MKKLLPYKILFFIFLIGNEYCFAQEKDSINWQLNTINVNYKKQDLTVNKTIKLDSVRREYFLASNISQLLNQSSAIAVKLSGSSGLATPAFRGTAGNQTKLFWNNTPINANTNGVLDLNLLPVFIFEDATVAFGAAGLNNGSGGLGGSILLASNNSHRNTFEVLQAYGSFGTTKTFSSWNYTTNNRKISGKTKIYRIFSENNFNYKNVAKLNHPIEKQQHANALQQGFLQQAAFIISKKWKIETNIWVGMAERQLPPPMSSVLLTENQTDKFIRNHLRLNRYSNKINFTTEFAYNFETLRYINKSSALNALSKSHRYFIQPKINYLIGKINAETSLQYKYDLAQTDGYKQLKTQLLTGIYQAFNLKHNKKTNTQIALRPEFINGKLMPLVASISSRKYFTENKPGNIYYLLNTNYNYPNLNDLYWIPGGNPDLLPEKSKAAEIGISYGNNNENKKRYLTDATFYLNKIDNYIQWLPTTSGFWKAQNIKTVFARGAEFSATYFGKNIEWRNSYSFTKSTDNNKNSNNFGKQLIYVPLHNFSSLFNWQYYLYRFSLNYTFNGFRYTLADNSNYLPAYNLVNMQLQRDFIFEHLKFGLRFEIQNIFNENYQSVAMRPMPGRYYELALQIKLQ